MPGSGPGTRGDGPEVPAVSAEDVLRLVHLDQARGAERVAEGEEAAVGVAPSVADALHRPVPLEPHPQEEGELDAREGIVHHREARRRGRSRAGPRRRPRSRRRPRGWRSRRSPATAARGSWGCCSPLRLPSTSTTGEPACRSDGLARTCATSSSSEVTSVAAAPQQGAAMSSPSKYGVRRVPVSAAGRTASPPGRRPPPGTSASRWWTAPPPPSGETAPGCGACSPSGGHRRPACPARAPGRGHRARSGIWYCEAYPDGMICPATTSTVAPRSAERAARTA